MATRLTHRMSWNECRLLIGRSTAEGALSTSLFDLGVLKNQTATLTYTPGDELVAKASGGVVVAREKLEGSWQLKFTITEIDLDTYSYIMGKPGTDTTKYAGHTSFGIESGLVPDRYSVIVIPKNTDAVGFYAAVADVSVAPAISETDGFSVEFTFDIVKDVNDEFLRWFYTLTSDRTKVWPSDPRVADGSKPAPTSLKSNSVTSSSNTTSGGSK